MVVRMIRLAFMIAGSCGPSCALGIELRASPDGAYVLGPGPQLLVDDFLLDRVEGVTRCVVRPNRILDGPIVTGAGGHKNWQPWLTVLRDDARVAESRFRMWYCADVIDDVADDAYRTKIGYLESADGVTWPSAPQFLETPPHLLFGASVIDGGSGFSPPDERYKVLYWRSPPDGARPGPAVAFSPDGLEWTEYNDGRPIISPSPGGDSWHAAYDSRRARYFLVGKSNEIHEWVNAEGRSLRKRLRLFGSSVSDDFKQWKPLQMWFAPDEKDPGITEGYGVTGFMFRGELILAFLQVLRDDLTCAGAPPDAVAANLKLNRTGAGMGHTVLCWSRDGGETWSRDRHTDPFLLPNPEIGSWDHAMAWVAGTASSGDEVLVYYGGYRWGHKYRRAEDRQIGVVKVPRDRFVAREAGAVPGTITTKPLVIACDALSLNVAAAQGEAKVQVCDLEGRPLRGFAFADCRPIVADDLAAPIAWQASELRTLRGRTVRLQLMLRQARLFALDAR